MYYVLKHPNLSPVGGLSEPLLLLLKPHGADKGNVKAKYYVFAEKHDKNICTLASFCCVAEDATNQYKQKNHQQQQNGYLKGGHTGSAAVKSFCYPFFSTFLLGIFFSSKCRFNQQFEVK